MSHLSDWVSAHGLDELEACERSGISYSTWRYLMAGYPTIPCLALECGHNLGMTPEEVKPLGICLPPERFTESDLLIYYPECFDPDWYLLVKEYKPKKPPEETEETSDKPKKRTQYCTRCGKIMPWSAKAKYCTACIPKLDAGGNAHYCVQCGKRFTESTKTKFCSFECQKMHSDMSRMPRRKCLYCGKVYEPRTQGQMYCSDQCCDKANKEKKRRGKAEKPTMQICQFCGSAYMPSYAGKEHRYCSDNCRAKARYLRRKEEREGEKRNGS